ncbi:MAG: glycine cleavage system aminomethyltransferase GcvT [Acidobacteriota bacterium]
MVRPQRLPLHDCHHSLGARFIDFGGWRMPVQYSGILDEHLAVRAAAGLFDISHMGEIEVRGPNSGVFLQRLTMNNVEVLEDGRAQYTGLLTPRGTLVDDLIIYRVSPEEYLLVVNAANARKDYEWLQARCERGVALADLSVEFVLLALQGPRAVDILTGLSSNLAIPGPFRHARVCLAGVNARVARTGYTGEDGFEIFVSPGDALAMWNAIVEAGGPVGLRPVGLGARETLRLEAGLLLYGQDIDEQTTPLEAGLGRFVCLEKEDFLGRDVLRRQHQQGVPRRLIGFEMIDPGVPRSGYPVWVSGRKVGAVTSGGFAPSLRKSVGLVYLPAGEEAQEVGIEIRGRQAAARPTPLPFYRRARSGTKRGKEKNGEAKA